MKKPVFAAVLLLLLILLIVALSRLYFAPAQLVKNYLCSKLEETFGLPASIEDIRSDLFSGLKIEGIKVANPPGFSETPLLSIESAKLKYNLWTLLLGKFTISQVEVISPQLLIEKNPAGELNTGWGKKKTKAPLPQKPPLNFLVSTFSIREGQILYLDRSRAATREAALREIQARADGILLSFIKPLRLKGSAIAAYEKLALPFSFSCPLSVDLKTQGLRTAGLRFELGPEKVLVTASAEAKYAGPRLEVQGALFSNNLHYQDLKVSEAAAKISFKDGILYLEINPLSAYEGTLTAKARFSFNGPEPECQVHSLHLQNFNAAPFSKDFIESFLPDLESKAEWKEKFHGIFSFSVSGSARGASYEAFLKNSHLQGILALKNGKLVHLRSLEQIAEMLKTPSLAQDLAVKAFTLDFKLYQGILSLSNASLQDTDIRVAFNGSADLINGVWQKGNLFRFIFSPALSAKLPQGYSILKNNRGEAEVEFELTGPLKKPVPIPKIEQPIERALQKLAPKILERLAPLFQ